MAIAATPPPSLVSDASTAHSYSRNRLLSLAQTPYAHPPEPIRLQSFSEIIRQGSIEGDWGINEENSKILDGEPISKALPVPVSQPSVPDVKDVLFNFTSSVPAARAAPVMIDFTHPDPFQSKKDTSTKASSVFLAFPSASGKPSTPGTGLAMSMGETYTSLRRDSNTRSRTSSFSSGSSINSVSGHLNPFAAPWPLPADTPDLTKDTTTKEEPPSLPLPKILPSSLPPKPSDSLPPVFVKRESATLPQPMAVPDVAPLGEQWEGESALSGNERRRRASEMVIMPRKGSEGRPERLVKLGARLRESFAEQSRMRGVKT